MAAKVITKLFRAYSVNKLHHETGFRDHESDLVPEAAYVIAEAGGTRSGLRLANVFHGADSAYHIDADAVSTQEKMPPIHRTPPELGD